MKKYMMIMVLGALMACLVPAQAQSFKSQPTQPQQEWKTTTMQGSGSAYSSQVTAVGAATATQQATTTYSGLPGGGPRKSGYYDEDGDWHPDGEFNTGGETGQSEQFPLGDAMWPLLLMAVLYGGWCLMRRRSKA